MDLAKFLSLLHQKALFFSRADLLGDPFEGSLTLPEANARRVKDEERIRLGQRDKLNTWSSPRIKSLALNKIVNCWHMNSVESMAMWHQYVSSGQGIAIESTFDQLARSLPARVAGDKGINDDGSFKELRVRIGMVRYIDFATTNGPSGVDRILLKRSSFAHEQEIRAVASDLTFGNSPVFNTDGTPVTRFVAGGDYVAVDLDVLISGVYVAPSAPHWFASLVSDVVTHYGYSFRVQQSDLDRDPVY
jgi:hypothetical protein